MNFIELHYKGKARLVPIDKISALGYSQNGETFIRLVGYYNCLYVDESYDVIKNKLQEVGMIWNV